MAIDNILVLDLERKIKKWAAFKVRSNALMRLIYLCIDVKPHSGCHLFVG